jgi:hypothetical protein
MSTLIFCRSGQASAEKIIEKTGSSSPKMNGLQYNLVPASTRLRILGKHPPDRKRSKFVEAQIAFILQRAEEGTAVGEVCRKAGISEATFYNWRKKYAGLMPSEVKRLRQLEDYHDVS